MVSREAGARAVRFLIDRGRLDRIDGADLAVASEALAPIEQADADWALSTSRRAVDAAADVLASGSLARFVD